MHIKASNTNTLAPLVYGRLQELGCQQESRNGPVLRFPHPVCLEITNPMARVNFNPVRDCNPFFHLMEALAMLGSLNSCTWLCRFNKQMAKYSDNGAYWNSFYGERLRYTWGDQLAAAVRVLRDDPESRQVVCQLWHPDDLEGSSKDKACNTQIMFQRNPLATVPTLDMTVINRSNDAIWGSVTGANLVHFSFFQEYVAASLGWGMGSFYTLSNNLHVYTENPQWNALKDYPSHLDFASYEVIPEDGLMPLLENQQDFDHDLDRFLEETEYTDTVMPLYREPFINFVAVPVFNAWICRKYKKDMKECRKWLGLIQAADWKASCIQWVNRRESK